MKMRSNDSRKHVAPSRLEERRSSRQAGMQLEDETSISPAIDRSPMPKLVTVRPSCVASVFCFSLSPVLETACVAASLEHSEETK